MPQRGQDIPIKIGAGGWDGRFTVEKPVLKQGYVLARNFNQNEAQKLAESSAAGAAAQPHSAQSSRATSPAASAVPHQASVAVEGATIAATPREITHSIVREGQQQSQPQQIQQPQQPQQPQQQQYHQAPASQADQLDSNASNFHERASHTTVLPARWDGTFAPGPAYRPKASQHTNTNNFYGFNTEPTILPTVWDGKFVQGTEVRQRPETNRSDQSALYGFSTEPTVLPAEWDGKFVAATGPGSVYTVPERNQSELNAFYGFDTSPTVLPTQWSGKFEVDPTDVRLKPERNVSDVRDYADHRRFREVKN